MHDLVAMNRHGGVKNERNLCDHKEGRGRSTTSLPSCTWIGANREKERKCFDQSTRQRLHRLLSASIGATPDDMLVRNSMTP